LRLEAENAVLRQQVIVLRRRLHGRVRLTNNDRWFFIQLYRRFPSILQVLTIIRPETLVRWHGAGFRCYWRAHWEGDRRSPDDTPSTTSTEQSALFGYLLPRFKDETGIGVKVVAVGTGHALDVGRRGDADVDFVTGPPKTSSCPKDRA
jgi:hypothetical protein